MTHVLVVDDDVAFSQTCSACLRCDGCDVSEAASVAAAVRAVQVRTPDAILLDWKLPDGTGLDLLCWLDSRRLRIPAALVTGFWVDDKFDEAADAARRLGVSACVRRGIDLDDPTEIVRRIVDPLVNLHSEVLRGNEAAREMFAATMIQALVPRLRARFRSIPAESASDAVTDAVIDHLNDPTAFNPVRHVSIEKFIWMRARRDLSNALRSARRDAVRDTAYAYFHSSTSGPNSPSLRSEHLWTIELALRREPDTQIRSALRHWLAGDQGPEPWRDITSFGILSIPGRTREVKRQKDRFLARLKRLSNRLPSVNK